VNRPPGYIEPKRERFPAALAEKRQWLAWRFAERADPETGEIKLTKEPINARTGGLGSSTDPSTWATLNEAWTRYEQDALDGVGFALNGNGLAGIDIDKCRDPETGKVTAEAGEIVRKLDSYTEISPSGTGLRVFAYGVLPPKGRKRGPIEMYESGRYLTVTGAHFEGSPLTIEARAEQVLALHKRTFGDKADGKARPARQSPRPAHRTTEGSDQAVCDEVIERARAGKSGKKFAALYDKGDWRGQGYPSQSEADLAICGILARAGASANLIDSIVRSSKLMRRKWDEVHSADGSTYGQMTIAESLSRIAGNEADGEESEYHPNNAGRRMVRLHGENLLHCGGEWYFYDGKLWRVDDRKHIETIARDVVETYREEAEQLYLREEHERGKIEGIADETERVRQEEVADEIAERAKRCWSFYMAMSRPKGIRDVLEAASWDLVVQRNQLDSDPYLLNAQNGTVDLRTADLLPHKRCDLITKLAPCRFEPEASSELWQDFLDKAVGGDIDLRRYMQRASGSALIGLQMEDLILLLTGPGGSGKTTYLEATRCAIGDYGKPVPFDIFLEKKHSGGTTPELASLPGVRMVTSAEPKENVGFDVARLKMLSGGDEVMANPKYLKPFTFQPVFTIVLATNHAPKASGADSGLWRRLKVIRFDRVIKAPNKKVRLHLAGKIQGDEADPRHQEAVLAWLVQGAREYIEHGLGELPQSVAASTESSRRAMDSLWGFLETRCVLDADAWTPTDMLRAQYAQFAADRGMALVDDAAWGTTLVAWGAEPRKRTIEGRSRRGWERIRLNDAGQDAASEPEKRPGNGQEVGFQTP
jgi:putative DNA primase/helicase